MGSSIGNKKGGYAIGHLLLQICPEVVTGGDPMGSDTSATQEYLIGFTLFEQMNRENRVR